MTNSVRVRESLPQDDNVIAGHFFRMWEDNGVGAERIYVDWEHRVLAFIADARRELKYRAFVAESEGGGVVGSASCQLFAGLYPDVLVPEQRRYGYVWGVYVEREARRRGIAGKLTEAAMAYLTAIGCTHALLHASPAGRPVYAGLGFEPTNEMRLALVE